MSRVPALVRTAAIAGLVVTVVGTFLPWLHSGTATRSSYAAGGAARRLLGLDGALGAALVAWPFLGLACAVAAALLLLGRLVAGAALALVCALVAGAAAVVVLGRDAGGLVGPAGLGPGVTLAGAVLTALAALVAFAPMSRRPYSEIDLGRAT